MTLAEYIQTGAVISGVFVAVGTFLLSFRSTSFTELKTLFTELKEQLDKAEKKIKEYETLVENLQAELETVRRQADNYKRWMTKAIEEIKRLGGNPPNMDNYDR